MSSLLCLPGSSALSTFRLNRLLQDIHTAIPAIVSMTATFEHWLNLERSLEEEEINVLLDVLDDGEEKSAPLDANLTLWVVPRFGTISPWSSKATDILHNCDLGMVRRVERCVTYRFVCEQALSDADRAVLLPLIHDRMIEQVVMNENVIVESLFVRHQPRKLERVALGADPQASLRAADQRLGLALADDEISYLVEHYADMGRDPSDVELMMFAQANSEHCRHKIFNADWTIDGAVQEKSLFAMIRNTYQHNPEGVLSAYRDNASVIEGWHATWFHVDPQDNVYALQPRPMHILMKVETHNHPTAISPFPGAATGSGGEIRDEGATGIGGRPKAGLAGFSVSDLKIPGFMQPWEADHGKPERIVSALDIMIEGPIGSAAFNNEFGRPNICGYFRTFEEWMPTVNGKELRGYHKPIMLAGGVGNILEEHVEKNELPEGTPIVVLGGPAMLIGLGGGAASSVASGASAAELDFASVQRGNPEIERRAQEVINACIAQDDNTPVLSIHDVGAGGISNAVPEIINDAGRGGVFELRDVLSDEPGMSPMEIWCNESQERYVLAIDPNRLDDFKQLCERERCPYSVIGHATQEQQLKVNDKLLKETPVDLAMSMLLGKPPKMQRDVTRRDSALEAFDTSAVDLSDAIKRVLQLPAVASKQFLISIGDRTVTGLITRDQMVGPWQVPVADVAVTSTDLWQYTGEAMAMGERAPIALVNAAASGRMAIAESLLNIAAAAIDDVKKIRLSANWMAAAGHDGEDALLYDTVKAVGEEVCPALGIAIPVGKDSMSMKTVWQQDGEDKSVTGPLSVIISAFAPVSDVRATLTPELKNEPSRLLLLDLSAGKQRMGGSALAQVYQQIGDEAPDLNDVAKLKAAFDFIQLNNAQELLLSYHDRSDGGLLTTLAEMAFAAHQGVTVNLSTDDLVAELFNEELGAVIQVADKDYKNLMTSAEQFGVRLTEVAALNNEQQFIVQQADKVVYSESLAVMHAWWHETSYRIQAIRDNSDCAEEERQSVSNYALDGLSPVLSFNMDDDVSASLTNVVDVRPKVAVLREQGVNGQVEMAAAFTRAGFDAVDVHMSDLIEGRTSLKDFSGLVACGGFSYGDVLGAGGGWAKSVLYHERVRDEFEAFFHNENTFALGVCNGCQMMSQLKALIPGADHWPRFLRNRSEQFEARLSQVEILPSPSAFLSGMQGSRLPIAVAHGEGRSNHDAATMERLLADRLISMRYVNAVGEAAVHYPDNPNGSAGGATAYTSKDGRFTIMMPHPERVFRSAQLSWHPQDWGDNSPWLRMFRNARIFVG